MSEWRPKRFWKQATVAPAEGGYAVLLDGRQARTPGKLALVVPGEALARAVAAEWQAQEGMVRPETMPFTRTANSALEKVAPRIGEVAAMVAEYGGTDLLCYRAAGPDELVRRQQAWDELLDWAAGRYGARLAVTEGVIPIVQPPDALARLAAEVGAMDAFHLAAFHDLVALTGSLILGLALAENRLDTATAWALSRLDEDFQAEEWGVDVEAAEAASIKRQALEHAKKFHDLVHLPDS